MASLCFTPPSASTVQKKPETKMVPGACLLICPSLCPPVRICQQLWFADQAIGNNRIHILNEGTVPIFLYGNILSESHSRTCNTYPLYNKPYHNCHPSIFGDFSNIRSQRHGYNPLFPSRHSASLKDHSRCRLPPQILRTPMPHHPPLVYLQIGRAHV